MTNPLLDDHNDQLERQIRILEQQEEILDSIARKNDKLKKDLSTELPNFMLQRK